MPAGFRNNLGIIERDLAGTHGLRIEVAGISIRHGLLHLVSRIDTLIKYDKDVPP
jgi:hypothetical protein